MFIKLFLVLLSSSLLITTTPAPTDKSVIIYPLSAICPQYTSGTCPKSIAMLDPVTLESTTLNTGLFSPNSQRMSPLGDRIAFASGSDTRQYVYVMDIETGLQAKLVEIKELLVYLAWSHNGSYFAYTTTDGNSDFVEKLYVVEQNGRNNTQIAQDLPIFGGIEWSPTEEKLAFMTRIDQNGQSGVYVYDLKRDEITQIDSSSGHHSNPVWSPDGSQIAFISDRTEKSQVYIADLETGTVSQVTDEIDGAAAPSWAFGGKSIVYYMMNWEDYYFKMIDLETDTITPIPMTGNVGSADVSPKGDQMVYVEKMLPDSRLCLVDLQDLSNRCLDVLPPFMQGEPQWVRVPAD